MAAAALELRTAVKLASIVVHADEILSGPPGEWKPGPGFMFDLAAIRSLIDDPDVKEFIKSLDPALLPVKRG